MRLYRTEVRRALTRRSVRVLAVVLLFNLVVAGVVVFLRHDSDEGAAAKLTAAAESERGCLAGSVMPPGSVIPDPELAAYFGDFAPEMTSRTDFCTLHRQLLEREIRRFELAQTKDVADSLQTILILMALVLGASLIGAEWAANTVATHLTWEPRRVRTYLAKAAAAMTVAAGFMIVTEWLMVASLYPSALLRGSTGVPATFWGDLAGVIARGGVAAAMVAGLGFAIAATTRSTVFALAFVFLLFILDALIVNQVALDLRRWSLFSNLSGYVSARGIDPVIIGDATLIAGRSPGGAGIVLASYIASLLALGSLLFRRRDVS